MNSNLTVRTRHIIGCSFFSLFQVVLSVEDGISQSSRYFLGGGASYLKPSTGGSYSFDGDIVYGGQFGLRLGKMWRTRLSVDFGKLTEDRVALSEFSFTKGNLFIERTLLQAGSPFNAHLGLGAGLIDWKVRTEDTLHRVLSKNNVRVPFEALELLLSGTSGIRLVVTKWLSLDLGARLDYFTGAGTNFSAAVDEARDRLHASYGAAINVHFGRSEASVPEWRSDESWQTRPEPEKSDTARRQEVVTGDADSDGVPDSLDHCPGTPAEARSLVDIRGCPIDSDFDGVLDYRDKCPASQMGAQTDSLGCPIDDDHDGIPNGLDDCPETLPGMEVDARGCLDLSVFDKPLMLMIDYQTGSFEIDAPSKERLRKVAGLLILAPHVRLEVTGHTDNIGTETANRELSLRRANRIRDYLVAQGVETVRIKTFGRGEAEPVATNATAAGREKNRRIEIVFFK